MGVKKSGFDEARKIIINNNGVGFQEMLVRLQFLGEQMCNHAREITTSHSNGGYDDHSGNLRSSIGYRLFYDGKPVAEGGFKSVGGEEGVDKAKTALDNFSRSPKVSQTGWTLLIVAGMNYAQYVEDKGYNVLFLTGVELERKIEDLKKKLGL